jgi:DNA-binding NtrC family response regulator
MDSRKKVLVIDDDASIRDVLKDYLQEHGFEVMLAADGLEGLDMIKQGGHDILILDIRMPYVSGIGLLKIIKQHSPDTPVICMTGYGESPEKIAEQERVDVILSKPFDLQDLLQEIQKRLA